MTVFELIAFLQNQRLDSLVLQVDRQSTRLRVMPLEFEDIRTVAVASEERRGVVWQEVARGSAPGAHPAVLFGELL